MLRTGDFRRQEAAEREASARRAAERQESTTRRAEAAAARPMRGQGVGRPAPATRCSRQQSAPGCRHRVRRGAMARRGATTTQDRTGAAARPDGARADDQVSAHQLSRAEGEPPPAGAGAARAAGDRARDRGRSGAALGAGALPRHRAQAPPRLAAGETQRDRERGRGSCAEEQYEGQPAPVPSLATEGARAIGGPGLLRRARRLIGRCGPCPTGPWLPRPSA